MKGKFLMTPAIAVLFACSVSAKEISIPDDDHETTYCCESTSKTDGQRYEILRDASDGRPCFRLDKYTGEVWSLNRSLTSVGNYDICLIEESPYDIIIENQINYQLYVHSSTHAILMNLNSGELWEYDGTILDRKPKFRLMTARR